MYREWFPLTVLHTEKGGTSTNSPFLGSPEKTGDSPMFHNYILRGQFFVNLLKARKIIFLIHGMIFFNFTIGDGPTKHTQN